MKPASGPRPVTLTLPDFSGGLNADQAAYPLALAENELMDILNFKYVKTPKGVKLRSRDGITKVTNVAPFPGAVLGIYGFTSSVGASYILAVANQDLNYLDSGTYTKIGDLSAINQIRFCTFDDKLIVNDGYTCLKYWDGSTFGVLRDDYGYLINNIDLTPLSSDANLYMYSGSKVRIAQHLTLPLWGVGVDLTVTEISVKLKKTGSPTGNVTCVIYAANGSTVVSTSSTTVNSASLTTDWVSYPFTFSIALSPNTAYYISINYGGGDSSNYVSIHNGTTWGTPSGAISGVGAYYDSSWHDHASADLLIRIAPNTAPYGMFVIQKRDRIYCVDYNNLNWLRYCNAGDPNDWSTEDGGGYIIFDGHRMINGLAIFYDEIYVFCIHPKAIYRLSGDSPEEYSVKKLFDDVTAISHDTIQNVGNDLLFVDSRGVISLKTILQYGEIEKSIISKSINNTYILPNVTSLSYATKCVSDNQYWLSVTSTIIAVYDLEIGGWTLFSFELGSAVTIYSLGLINGDTYIGASSGHLYYLDYTKDQDSGTDFSLMAKTGWLDFNTLMVKTGRFADSLLISAIGETYDLEIYKDFNSLTPVKTLSQVSLSQNGAYHSPYCGNLNEVNFNFNQVMFKLTNIASGQGPYWLDRIVFEANILGRLV
jgi:hypothetical protein